ncbi:MAG TPA: EamA family transporter [Candidatus Ruthenibacterium merdigallinarum]|nr:EamA family transporter [Candidatus Ruthenibacterium merdigallinarum]
MSWFVFSLIAILFWSGSDLFSKMGSRPDDKLSHWKMVMAVGAVMGAHAVIMLCMGTPFQMSDIITYLPASLLYILSMIFGYVGLRYIELSISSPVCNSSGAVAAILCFALLGQAISGLQLVGIILVCAGVFALSYIEKKQDDAERAARRELADVKYERSVLAIVFPLLYCAIDGLGTFADALILENSNILEDSANIAYELTFLLMAVVAFVYVVLIKKERIRIGKEKVKLAAGLSETIGQYFYIFAIGANAVVAAPMISSYCVVSLIWARLFLKERLTPRHYAVIAVTAVGIAILGME